MEASALPRRLPARLDHRVHHRGNDSSGLLLEGRTALLGEAGKALVRSAELVVEDCLGMVP